MLRFSPPKNSVLCRGVCEMTIQKQIVRRVQAPFWLTLSQLTVSQPIGLLGTGLMITGTAIVLSVPVAQAASLQWQYDPDSAALSVNLPPGTTPRYFLAAQPARIVIDLPNTDVGTVQTQKQFPGAVQQIRVAQFQPGVTRIVMQLASGTVLAPQQVDLQQNGNQWVLRPVLADANSAPAQTIASQSAAGQMAAVNPAIASADNSIPGETSAASANPAPETLAAQEATLDLPPLEPGATEIPVELPPAEATAAAPPTVSVPDLSASEHQAAENPAFAPQATEQFARTSENAAETMAAAIPAELPPAQPDALPTELPPATFTPSAVEPAESSVNVPALNPPSPSPASSRDIAAIEFGQPLPGTEAASRARAASAENLREASGDVVAVNSTPGVLLPSGAVLSLRYQGEETLNLSSDYPLQEVLVVDRDVQDQSGRVIVPAGSQVIGRFETGSSGSEFIAQAISINGQNFLLNGRSDKLSGDRQPSRNHLIQNSAIGAVAGTLLGAVTGIGLVAGIAAGAATSAATTYLTAPQPAVIEPDRVVEVRLIEDLRQPGYGIGG